MIQPISVFNNSTLVSQATLSTIMAAINNVSMPAFAKAWGGLQAELTWDRPAGAWPMWILDQTSIQGDLAFHLDQNNIPLIKVFAETIREAGASLCEAIDHETKEALRDPTASQTIIFQGDPAVDEVCDPVSGDGINLGGGLTGANFIHPSWQDADGKPPYDERGLCTRPFEIRPGGYVERLVNGQWQLTAMRGPTGHSWRLNYPGRLAYRARNRAP